MNQVHPDSLAFGPEGAPRAHRNGPHYTDADGDGLLDLITHFHVQETGLQPGDEELCLTGETLEGVPFEGCDAVSLVGSDNALAEHGDGDDHGPPMDESQGRGDGRR